MRAVWQFSLTIMKKVCTLSELAGLFKLISKGWNCFLQTTSYISANSQDWHLGVNDCPNSLEISHSNLPEKMSLIKNPLLISKDTDSNLCPMNTSGSRFFTMPARQLSSIFSLANCLICNLFFSASCWNPAGIELPFTARHSVTNSVGLRSSGIGESCGTPL
ncbi:hypothetical protein WICPIJ_001935 [Wickerhamomyces pijperi]|uniref:Uncharacterized protein n=1 Tax=Wickerhamomyces pijperi TaxID=599730 RepID=A0A9P8QAS4_WICPI|nr:hypothetical protein WICPIJ_001935 [Wickerhamomyces pijperi]